MRVLMLLIILMLSGCVSYTNDKGQRCVFSLDPSAILMMDINNCYGEPNETNDD